MFKHLSQKQVVNRSKLFNDLLERIRIGQNDFDKVITGDESYKKFSFEESIV